MSRGRLLLIDDDAVVRRALARMLARQYDVVHAESACEALHQLEAGARFDAILCDLIMPDLSGAGFYEQVHARFADQACRIILMTGMSEVDPDLTAMLGGRIVQKPIDLAVLRALVAPLVAPAAA
jgi:DNA-binding NtrC family response regulator